jgi:hypothetical protein
MARLYGFKCRDFLGAGILGKGATGVKAAASRQSKGRRHATFNGKQRFPFLIQARH